eukprot:m.288323 g.288323  ORF g.288323 m.288323 type:complete len:286 (+) comp11949_c0_seq1:72-929(+)
MSAAATATGSSSSGNVKFDYTGQLVLVTGSTGGIGRAIAEGFFAAGATVCINGRSEESVSTAIDEIKQAQSSSSKGKLVAAAGDVSTPDGASCVCAVVDELGDLDVLVNNVGIFKVKGFDEADDAMWDLHWQVNVMSAVRLSRHYLSKMLKRNSGRILQISSETGWRPLTQFLHYSVSKTALISLARGLAELCKGTAVTVNSVLAGPTWTPGVSDYIDGFAEERGIESRDSAIREYFSTSEPTSLLQRFIDPPEIAAACLFLASTEAAAINGHAQRVEGGIIRSI